MNAPVSIDEILSPEELAACEAYFITTSNNALDDLAEPPCFRIWFRLVLLLLRRAGSSNSADCGPSTQVLPSPTSSIAALPSTASIVLRDTSGSSRGSLTTIVSSSQAPPTKSPRSSVKLVPSSASFPSMPSPKAKSPAIDRTKPAALKPLITPTVLVKPAKSHNISPALDKPMDCAPSKVSGSTTTRKPSATIPSQHRPSKSTSPVAKRQNSSPVGFQTAKRSIPMPASAITAKRPSISGSRVPTAGSTASNATVQSTTRMTTQPAAQPGLPPTTPAAGKSSAVALASGHSSRISTPLTVSRPSASSPPRQPPSTQPSVPIAPSRTGQPRSNSLPSAPAPPLIPLISKRKASIDVPSSSRMAELERKFEALGDPKITVHKSIYEGLRDFYLQHRSCTRRSNSSSHPTTQATVADSPIRTSSKRKFDDVGEERIQEELTKAGGMIGQPKGFGGSDKERKIRGIDGHDNNGRDRESSHGLRESQFGRNHSDEPRRKHRRDRYGDYYGSNSD